MLLRKVAAVAAVCALAAVGAASASATTDVYCGNTATLCPSGTAIGSNTISGNAVLTSGLGTITCTEASFMGTVGASGGATVSGTLTDLAFGTTPPASPSGCSGTGFAANITYCHTGAISKAIVAQGTSTNTGTVSIPSGLAVTCKNSSGGTVCTFTTNATVTGSASFTEDALGNITSNSLAFSTTAVAGSFPCPSSGNSFSVTFTNIVSGANTDGALVGIGSTP